MKCAICTILNEKRYFDALKKDGRVERNEAPEAVASFNTSKGMVAYICHQHLAVDIAILDKLITTGKIPE